MVTAVCVPFGVLSLVKCHSALMSDLSAVQPQVLQELNGNVTSENMISAFPRQCCLVPLIGWRGVGMGFGLLVGYQVLLAMKELVAMVSPLLLFFLQPTWRPWPRLGGCTLWPWTLMHR